MKNIAAMSREEKRTLVRDAADAAINAGCLHIQQAIGQNDGGVAGVFFSGVQHRQELERTLLAYLEYESAIEGYDFHAIPLNLEIPFAELEFWRKMGEAENVLAEKLASLPEGTAVCLDDKEGICFLKVEDGKRILKRGTLANGRVTDVTSRHDFELDYVDVENDELDAYTAQIYRAVEEFSTIDISGFQFEEDD